MSSPGTTANVPGARSAARRRGCGRPGRCSRRATEAEHMIRERDFPRRAIFAGLACLAVLASACTSLETRITRPGSRALLDAGTLGQMESALGIERRSFQVPDGPRSEEHT